MINPRSWLTPWRLLVAQHRLIDAQQTVMEWQAAELNRIRLEHFREVHGIVDAWLVHHDQPEVDMRPELLSFSTQLGDRIAAIEELIL
jgi:hypothetical protein